jgi:hypothetical protein
MMFMSMTFLIHSSSLCTSVGNPSSCKLNNGGISAIASVLLWFVAWVVAMVYVQSPNEDVIVTSHGTELNLFQQRKQRRMEREFQRQEEKRLKQLEKERVKQQQQREAMEGDVMNTTTSQSAEDSFDTTSNPNAQERGSTSLFSSWFSVHDDVSDELEVCLAQPEGPVIEHNDRV